MITVPQGGSVAGRSADIRIENPDIGGFVSQVGSAVAQKMGQIKEQQRSIVVEKTKLDMTKDQGEAYQRIAQLTDPAEIESAWATEQTALRDKYVNGKDAAGNPLLTPDEADALTLTFDGLATKHGFALGERTVKLTESQATAAWSAARLDIVNTAATADPDTMAALVEYGEAAIDRLPGLMPDQKQEQKAALRAEVTNARAITALDQDPAAFIAAAEAGTYDALGGERVAQLKVTAQAEADRRAASAATAGEAEAKERADAIGDRLDTIADLALKGRIVEDEKYLSDPEIQSHPDYPKAAAAVALRKEVPNLDVMTVAQIDAQIAAEEKKPITEKWQNERLGVLRGMRDKKAEALATDPKAALTEAGLPVPEMPDFDPSDTAGWSAALAKSVRFDGWQREKGYSEQSAIFTKDQKSTLKAVLAPGADAGPKVALMSAILDGTKGNANAVLADLEADPVSRRALKVLGVTRDTGLTEAILRGGQKLDGKTVVPPSRKEQILAFDTLTGGVFDDAPALKAELMEATLALYADGAKGIDGETQSTDGWIADGEAYTLYQQSVQRLLGAHGVGTRVSQHPAQHEDVAAPDPHDVVAGEVGNHARLTQVDQRDIDPRYMVDDIPRRGQFHRSGELFCGVCGPELCQVRIRHRDRLSRRQGDIALAPSLSIFCAAPACQPRVDLISDAVWRAESSCEYLAETSPTNGVPKKRWWAGRAVNLAKTYPRIRQRKYVHHSVAKPVR